MSDAYRELTVLIRQVRRRWLAVTALRAWSVAGCAVALILALALATDELMAPEGLFVVMLWAAAALASLAPLVWAGTLLRRTPGDGQVARLIEEQCPELEDSLVTAFGERDSPESRPLAAAVLDDAVRRAREVNLDRIVDRGAVRVVAVRAAAVTLLVCIVAGFAARPVFQAARVGSLYLFPHRLVIDVTPGDTKVRAGEPLRIVARIPGAAAGVLPMLRVDAGEGWSDTRMDAGTDGFTVAFARVEEGFRYAVAAAGASSREYTVTVIRPPRVERIDLRYEYPSGFGMEPRDEQDGGDIYGPAGTRVRLTVFPDKTVTQASLNVSGGRVVELEARGGVLEGELTIAEDGSYRVALTDEDGLQSRGETEYFIRTLEDRPPDVRIVRPATDRKVTAVEEVPIEASADDDFGVTSLELVYSVRGGAETVVPFERDGSAIATTGRRMLYLEELDVQPGDFVTYYARARDISRGKRSSESRSDIFFLEVAPFDEEFVAAQSQGGGGSGNSQSLEDLIQAQKDIISATWRLDRRGRDAGGRSKDDIQTVARAQAELRTRALAVVTQLQRPGDVRRRRIPGGRGTRRTADPTAEALNKAVEAMNQAQNALEALQTGDALPHEMTALNELLRADAANRRREVQQATNGVGRGMNRQQQDLSSLFDRELARQQQTAYETPQTETREQQTEQDDALEKIRELARRQDALSRQQQELARKDTSPEQLRRELERLTREQTELRQQAQDLARQLQRARLGEQGGRSGQSGQSGQNASAEREVQRISEEMQRAASELRRDNPAEASARSSEAAERLRDLERRIRGAQPDDQRRAVGELQLESRQLADAQRRLSRGSGAGQGSQPDAARRQAAEQARLADRAERLEQAVKDLAGAAEAFEPREQKALAEAARELERQRLSRRMREAAGIGRNASEKDGDRSRGSGRSMTPQEGEAIAGRLERLAEQLATAGGQTEESQRLTGELARLRQLREELTALDRELTELRKDSTEPGGSPSKDSKSQRPWQRAEELLEKLRTEDGAGPSPAADGFNPGLSAPGTEQWKQDFSMWDELKVQIGAALEAAESSAAAQLRGERAQDRLNAGTTQKVPEEYRRLVEQYYRALAAGTQPGDSRRP